ncbi:MAG: hypothetical protein HXY24_12325 [Rubrivivax sp.]|nr:hypothetical protein [Rubrivivax sp.]
MVVTALVSLVALVVGSLFSGVDGLLFGLVFGLIASLAGASIANTHQIQVAEALSWSYGKAIWGLTVGLAAGLIVEIVAMQSTGLFVIALPIGLALMLYQGLSRREVITSRIWPNQGIWQSAQNALKVGGTVSGASLICSLLVGLWVGNLRNILSLGLIIGVMASLTAGLAVGGAACLQHGVLRCILARSGYLPWRMTHFLDYGVKHILLSRVGGGYVFIHRRLMEYFAGLESD